jgi:hypothetical protein
MYSFKNLLVAFTTGAVASSALTALGIFLYMRKKDKSVKRKRRSSEICATEGKNKIVDAATDSICSKDDLFHQQAKCYASFAANDVKKSIQHKLANGNLPPSLLETENH